jgi:integrase
MAERLTKRTVDAAKPQGKERTLWDTDVRGFGVRVRPAGGKHFIFRYRLEGRQRFMVIGLYGQPWTVETARTEAKRLQGLVANGDDPATARDVAKARPTVEDIITRFVLEYVTRLKNTTSRNYCAAFARVVSAKLGSARIDRVARADVATYIHDLRYAPIAANRALAALSSLFSWVESLGFREPGSNPCRGVQRFKEQRRQRFLTAQELMRLGDVLKRAENGTLRAPIVDSEGRPVLDKQGNARMAAWDLAGLLALRLLLLTGARKNEVLRLKWSEIDVEGSCLRLSDSKTGPRVIPIGAPAVALLAGAPHIGEWVVPGLMENTHRADVKDVWNGQQTAQGRRLGIRDLADLKDVHVHDLRHAFASVAVSGGATLPLVGALLGHREQSTTQRYAHAAPDPVRAVAEQTSAHIANLLNGPVTQPDNVESIATAKKRRAR